MVKLVAVRSNRMYGPRQSQGAFELVNAVVYTVATLLLLGGVVLLLPVVNHDHPQAALIVLTISLCLIILVNLHDLAAQLAGIDFRLDLLTYDPQLALIEVGAPLVHTIGGMLFLIAVIFMLKVGSNSKTLGLEGRQGAALQLLVAGSVLWLLGSLHNAFQVYERASLAVQLYQKAVYLPLLIACTLYMVSSILWMTSWPYFVVGQRTQYAAATMAIVACVSMVIGAIANISRVIYLRKLVRASALSSSCAALDKLRGGAHEELESGRRHGREPLLEQEPPAAAPVPIVESEDTFAVIR